MLGSDARRRIIVCSLIASAIFSAQSLPAEPHYSGVNIAGGEFKSGRLPGTREKDYTYPRSSDFAPFAAAGMNTVRVPLLWERLQPELKGELDAREMRAVDASLRGLADEATLVVIDVHNYGRYRGEAITDGIVPADALPDLWRRLALRYSGDRRFAFGLMNEPHDMPAPAWRAIAESTVAAIRATGATNLILVPGVDWTGAHSWMQQNAAAFAGFRDPARNMMFEMHQYLDADSSGTKAGCTAAPERRLDAATAWLRREHQQGFLGEFGVRADPECVAALDRLLTRIDRDGNVWRGWTYWAAGRWWGHYPLSIQPDANGEKPQMAVLRKHGSG